MTATWSFLDVVEISFVEDRGSSGSSEVMAAGRRSVDGTVVSR